MKYQCLIALTWMVACHAISMDQCGNLNNKNNKCKNGWRNYCTDKTYQAWMKKNCAKLCCDLAKQQRSAVSAPSEPAMKATEDESPEDGEKAGEMKEQESPEEENKKDGEEESQEEKGLEAEIGVYPGFKPEGPPLKGEVSVSQKDDKTLTVEYELYGLASSSGGLHIHVGTSCALDAGDHYFNKAVTPVDPWTTNWQKDSNGAVKGSFDIAFGYNISQVVSHTVVVHDGPEKTKVGCGVLEGHEEDESTEEEGKGEKESPEEKGEKESTEEKGEKESLEEKGEKGSNNKNKVSQMTDPANKEQRKGNNKKQRRRRRRRRRRRKQNRN
jgi:Cu/Zn superoxide dismutase